MTQRATSTRPRGPRRPSPAVARRRRAVALAALALVIVLAVWGGIALAGGQGGSEAEASASATPSASASHAPSAAELGPTGDPNASPTPTGGAGAAGPATPTPSAPAAKPCASPAVRVTANLDAERYAAGARPQLSLTLENTGAEPCLIDVGTAKQVYTISSGSDRIWASTDCQRNAQSQLVELGAGQRLESPQIEWVRERSAKDTCDRERPAAVAGGATYTLTAAVDGISSEPRSFILD